MKLLVVAPYYPHVGHPTSGIFNERSVHVLMSICEAVEVLVPRPYAPPWISALTRRWRTYARIPPSEVRNGVSICRPAYLQVPQIGSALWIDPGMYIWSRAVARRMHHRTGFDAILSFDVLGSGGLAWRLGRDLGIPAAGWATGSDVRVSASSSLGKVVRRALHSLDVVFYQSEELRERGAQILRIPLGEMSAKKHVVLSRGISQPPLLDRHVLRERVRKQWNISAEQLVVLYLGRIFRRKGVLDLLEAMESAASRNPKIICVIVGCMPGFDESEAIQKRLDRMTSLKERVRLLPACSPEQIWEFHCAADIFAYPSHSEGMPNSLLEAMVMQLPCVAFRIPAVAELDGGTGSLVLVPPFDVEEFSNAIFRLAESCNERSYVGARGRLRVVENQMADKNLTKAVFKLKEDIRRRKLQG